MRKGTIQKRNVVLMKHYMKLHPSCEKCGRYIGCEVHHKIPVSEGGMDEYRNYITLCEECHRKEHIKDRGKLTQDGVERARNKVCHKAIDAYELNKIILDIVEEGKTITASEIIEIINNMDSVIWIDEK